MTFGEKLQKLRKEAGLSQGRAGMAAWRFQAGGQQMGEGRRISRNGKNHPDEQDFSRDAGLSAE